MYVHMYMCVIVAGCVGVLSEGNKKTVLNAL